MKLRVGEREIEIASMDCGHEGWKAVLSSARKKMYGFPKWAFRNEQQKTWGTHESKRPRRGERQNSTPSLTRMRILWKMQWFPQQKKLKKKTLREASLDAQNAHTRMCEASMQTMASLLKTLKKYFTSEFSKHWSNKVCHFSCLILSLFAVCFSKLSSFEHVEKKFENWQHFKQSTRSCLLTY